MPAHSVDALSRSVKKGELAPVYYLYGPEDVLKDDAVRSIIDVATDPAMRDFNLDQRSAVQLDPEEVHALCNTLPMMAEHRVILLRDVEAWKRKTKARNGFMRYLEHPNPQSVVILVQGSGEEAEDKELVRGAYAVRFEALSPERAAKWVQREAGKHGVAIEPGAAEHLVRSVGTDLGALSSELSKLASLPAGDPVTAATVGELVGIQHGETLWDWRSAVLDDESGRAVGLLPAVLAQPGMTGVKMVTHLGTALVGLGVARSLYDKGKRGGNLEDSIFRTLLQNRPGNLLGYKQEAAHWCRLCPNWPSVRVHSTLRAVLEADQALKSTTISDERGVLTDLILRIGLSKGGHGGESGEGGRIKTRAAMHVAARALLIASAFSAFSAFSALSAQTDPRLVEVIRHAQEGQSDSARIKVQRLLAATPPTDSLYPQIVYTQAMVSSDAADMRRQLQRVAVEYSSSSWADDALLRLVQLDYASGNLEGAARNLERIRLDYPGSSLLSQASYWAARTYFDQKKPELACRWIADGMEGARGNIELQNQLGYLNQRCGQVAAAGPRAAADSTGAVASLPRDTARGGAAQPDSATTITLVPETPTPPPPSRRDTVRTEPVPPPPAARSGSRYRVQITAVRNAGTARSIAAKLKSRGFNVVTVEEGGLYKVRVGDYATKADAMGAVPEIKAKLGGSPFVVMES